MRIRSCNWIKWSHLSKNGSVNLSYRAILAYFALKEWQLWLIFACHYVTPYISKRGSSHVNNCFNLIKVLTNMPGCMTMAYKFSIRTYNIRIAMGTTKPHIDCEGNLFPYIVQQNNIKKSLGKISSNRLRFNNFWTFSYYSVLQVLVRAILKTRFYHEARCVYILQYGKVPVIWL